MYSTVDATSAAARSASRDAVVGSDFEPEQCEQPVADELVGLAAGAD